MESQNVRRKRLSEDFDKKKTPKREQNAWRYDETDENEDSKISFLTASNRQSMMDKGNNNDKAKLVQVDLNHDNEHHDDKNHQILDFSSIKKFESSDSTLRKDSSTPDLYTDMPLQKDIEMSPEVKWKPSGSSDRHQQNSDLNQKSRTQHEYSYPLKQVDTNSQNARESQKSSSKKGKENASNFMDIDKQNLSMSNPFIQYDHDGSGKKLFKSKVSNDTSKLSDKQSYDVRRQLEEVLFQFKQNLSSSDFDRILNNHLTSSDFITKSIQWDSHIGKSSDFARMNVEIDELKFQVESLKSLNENLKSKASTIQERSVTLEKLLRDRESTLFNVTSENNELKSELENATLMEEQLKSEIDILKIKKSELDEKLKETKITKTQTEIMVRQLKDDIELKKREIIEACDLTSRVTRELEDVSIKFC